MLGIRHPWLLGLVLAGVATPDAKAQFFPPYDPLPPHDTPAWNNYGQGTWGWNDPLRKPQYFKATPDRTNEHDEQFSTCWQESQIGYKEISDNDSWMVIDLKKVDPKKPCNCESECPPRFQYASGQYESLSEYHYGQYCVRMQAAEGCGLVTGFFVFYADWEEVNGETRSKEWHEIDIEILGKATNEVQVNHRLQQLGDTKPSNNPVTKSLGFDAAEEMHDYCFVWLPDSITWYADYKEIYKVRKVATAEEIKDVKTDFLHLPDHKGNIMVNLWAGCTGFWAPCGKPCPAGCDTPEEPCAHDGVCAFGHKARVSVDWIDYTFLPTGFTVY